MIGPEALVETEVEGRVHVSETKYSEFHVPASSVSSFQGRHMSCQRDTRLVGDEGCCNRYFCVCSRDEDDDLWDDLLRVPVDC